MEIPKVTNLEHTTHEFLNSKVRYENRVMPTFSEAEALATMQKFGRLHRHYMQMRCNPPGYPHKVQMVQKLTELMLPERAMRQQFEGFAQSVARYESGLLTQCFMYTMKNIAPELYVDALEELLLILGQIKFYAKATRISDTPNWFRYSKELCQALHNTKCDGAVIADLKLPFEGFYLELPEGVIDMYDKTTGWHSCQCVGVCASERSGVHNVWSWQETAHFSLEIPSLSFFLTGELNENSQNFLDDSIFRHSLMLLENEKIEDIINFSFQQHNLIHGMAQALLPGLATSPDGVATAQFRLFGEEVPVGRPGLARVLSLLFNMLMALTVYNIGTTKRKSAQRRRPKKGKRAFQGVFKQEQPAHGLNIWDVGTKIHIPRKDGSGSQMLSEKEWKNPKIFLRSGHWRRQPYGPKNTLRRMKWILPHKVRHGIVDADQKVLGHDYIVSDK